MEWLAMNTVDWRNLPKEQTGFKLIMFQVRNSGTNICFSLTDSIFINLCGMFFCSDSQQVQVGQFFDYDSPFKDKTTTRKLIFYITCTHFVPMHHSTCTYMYGAVFRIKEIR